MDTRLLNEHHRALIHETSDDSTSSPSAYRTGSLTVPWGVREIKAPAVWERSTGNAIRIAVIDTGIDYRHPDLRGAAAGGVNLVSPGRPPWDDNGHGTHIAGTIAASSKIGGINGVAPEAHIYAVKAFDRNGTAYVSDIVAGIEWCIRNKMDIINMSFGMKTSHRGLQDAVKAAYHSGIVVVASSGNEGQLGDIDYPARYRQAIAVGATTRGGRLASFSNRGRRIDLYAPGDKIVSTWLNGGYRELSGTSMATSHVSGVIALLLSVRPGLSPAAIKRALTRGTTAVTRGTVRLRAGQTNAALCLKQALIPESTALKAASLRKR
ncbi:S8 family peptidase [Gorillibacterium timonense]|uniref:S8 family peptidase n=1 Tax=Gorillibacterium timonense TaxID=1689269 RepID=UPI00071E1D38|nr:S8 family peptidase [Gorillibacterium timonense]